MTRALVDLNILLDFLIERKGHSEAAEVIALVDSKQIEGILCAHELPTLAYFLEREKETPKKIRGILKGFCTLFEIVDLVQPIIQDALHSEINDFEDALMAASAKRSNCSVIITRNIKDFKKSKVKAKLPGEFLKTIEP